MIKITDTKTKWIKTTCVIGFLVSGLSSTAIAAPIEVVFSGSDPTATIGTDLLSQTAGGVTMTMRGYQVEIGTGGSETVYGPAPTTGISGREVFNYDPRNLGEPGIGYVSLPEPGYAVTESDLPGGGLIIPGFDTVSFSDLSTIEWMEIQFSVAVDVSFIDVDDTSNFDRNIWAVGLDGVFDYSTGLSDAIDGLAITNSQDSASDGAFRHSFSPIFGVTSLLVGSAPDFDLGNIEGQTRGSQFSITGLGFGISEREPDPDPGPASVPEPATAALILLGLAGLTRARTRPGGSAAA